MNNQNYQTKIKTRVSKVILIILLINGFFFNINYLLAQPNLEIKPDGILIPRLNKSNVTSPSEGQLIFDIQTSSFWFYSNSQWNNFKSSINPAMHEIIMTANRNDSYYSGYSYVGQSSLPVTLSNLNSNTWSSIASNTNLNIGTKSVWTGNKMLVTGNIGTYFGYSYSPILNTWSPLSNGINCPTGRLEHSAIWTGQELLVWGGRNSSHNLSYNSGAKYNPITDTWTTISSTNAPSPRTYNSAVWTGQEMIIWGGVDLSNNTRYNDGARYNPSTDTWTPLNISNAPTARSSHQTVWTGDKMIVWGGESPTSTNTGGIYDINTNVWTSTSTGTNCPAGTDASPHPNFAVWTGTEMLLWGGRLGGATRIRARYNPITNLWSTMTTTNEPVQRRFHSAIWTGTEMIIYGGSTGTILFDGVNSGGKYNPTTDTWSSIANSVNEKVAHNAIWTGNKMIIWGGNENANVGEIYNPSGTIIISSHLYIQH